MLTTTLRIVGRTPILLWILICSTQARSQNLYVGGLGGLATLSADGRSVLTPDLTQVSLYKPDNGPALNLFAGWDFSRYLSLQGNYIWNSNGLTLVSTAFNSAASSRYQELRGSRETEVIGDLLGYMRARGDRVRPYLSCGAGLEHFSSSLDSVQTASGPLPLPPARFSANHIGLRVAVGIDLKMRRGWVFRYSFSETIASNPVSPELIPPGQRGLKNFQNLFGLLWHF